MKILFARRRASALVEVLIAVIVLAIALVGVMSSGTIARMAVAHKDRGDASSLALRVLEWAETIPLSDDFESARQRAFPNASFGPLTFSVVRIPNRAGADDVSADITVEVSMNDGSGARPTVLTREVSLSAIQNAGDLP